MFHRIITMGWAREVNPLVKETYQRRLSCIDIAFLHKRHPNQSVTALMEYLYRVQISLALRNWLFPVSK
jgi:hypothetical protein